MLFNLQPRRLCLTTICLQVFLVAYFQFAPWEQINLDVEHWLEESAYEKSDDQIQVADTSTTEVAAPAPEEPRKVSRTAIQSHLVKKGETFSTIWNRYAGNLDRFPEAVSAFERAGLKRCAFKAGERLEIAVREGGDIRRIKKSLDDGGKAVLKTSETGEYVATLEAPKIREQQKTITATIYGSFLRTAAGASVPYKVADEMVDLFANRVDFSKDLQPGDTFSVIYSEKRVKGRDEALSSMVEAASMKVGGKFFAVVRYQGRDGKPRYYDEKGELLGNYFLRYPLQFSRISSVFSKARYHPILHVATPHPGVDFAAPKGTPVRAVADGLVVLASFQGGAGNMIRIKHDGKVQTTYMHLSKFAKNIRTGAHVKRGQVIGAVGSTGLSTGAHLDYRLTVSGSFINPLTSKLPQLLNQKDAIPPKLLQAALRNLESRHEAMAIAQGDIDSRKSRV